MKHIDTILNSYKITNILSNKKKHNLVINGLFPLH